MNLVNRPGGILTIAHFMPWAGMGGVEIATLRMVEATRQEFRHIAFCLPDARVRKSFADAGIETISYVPPVLSARHVSRYYRDSLIIARQLRRLDVDIVHFAETKADPVVVYVTGNGPTDTVYAK